MKILENKKLLLISSTILFITILSLSGFYFLYQKERRDELKGEAKFELSYRFQMQNDGPLNLTSVSLRLAKLKDWNPVQTVQSLSVRLPENRTTTDIYDNQFLWYEYENFQVNQYLDVQIDANLTLNMLDYTGIDFGDVKYNTNSEDYKLYMSFNPLTDTTDPGLQSVAKGLTDSTDPKEISFQAYNFSASYIRYKLLSEEKGSSFALRNGYGDCDEYNTLFISLMRSRGIPAIGHTAWLADFKTGLVTTDDGAAAHAYPMFYVEGMGLLPVDPTRGNTNIFENWLKTDEKVITMTRGPDQAYRLLRYRWVPVEGISDPVVVSNYTISIKKLDLNFFSNIRKVIISLVIALPVLFIIYNVIKGMKVKKLNDAKRERILSIPQSGADDLIK